MLHLYALKDIFVKPDAKQISWTRHQYRERIFVLQALTFMLESDFAVNVALLPALNVTVDSGIRLYILSCMSKLPWYSLNTVEPEPR